MGKWYDTGVNLRNTKILPIHHTGKLRHRHHTSYGALSLLLIMAFVPLMMVSQSITYADDPEALPPPVTGSETTYAVVPGAAPAKAPVITSPADGATYTTNNPVTLSGECDTGTLVKLSNNGVFSGGSFCQNNHFAIPISLFAGTNAVVADAYNTTDQSSPDSVPITLHLNSTAAQLPAGITFASGFFITSDVQYKGVKVGEPLSFPVVLAGGQAPYAVNVAWGDGKTDLISRGTAGAFTIEHPYSKPGSGYKGSYMVTVTATDQLGSKAFLQLVGIVGGTPSGGAATAKTGGGLGTLLKGAWFLLCAGILIVVSFWLGERREHWIIKHRYESLTT